MAQSKVPVGSLGYWAMMRVAQVTVICVASAISHVPDHTSGSQLTLMAFVWLLLFFYFDSYVYGFADESGIRFRRYVSLQFVPWTSVRRISWFGRNILSIHLKSGFFLRRELNANSSPKSFLVNPDDEPELVSWVQIAKPLEADGLELTPWGTDTITSRRIQSVLRILIPLASAAVVIWLLATMFLARS